MQRCGLAAAVAISLAVSADAIADQLTPYPSQMAGKTVEGWGSSATFTVGETIGEGEEAYTPPGILDGMYAWDWSEATVRVFVNHELTSEAGYPYFLKNGTQLTGGRVSFFDLDKTTRTVKKAGLAFDTIYNRGGSEVDDPKDLEFEGLNRLCSANGVEAGSFGFVDDVFFTGEETDGGSEWALDVTNGALWAVPAMGRGAWESVAAIEPPAAGYVALLVGDDREGAPLLLYVGQKDAIGDGSFLDRNGLAVGDLYVWAPRFVSSPQDFNGTGSFSSGPFKKMNVYNPNKAGNTGWDELGYALQETQDAKAAQKGAFEFSRPEDVHTNPNDATQIVLASTGGRNKYPADKWGTLYTVKVNWFVNGAGKLKPWGDVQIIFDGDDAGGSQFSEPDRGIRSPDNLVWSGDGYIYVQEDRSTSGFGDVSGKEASVWQLDPVAPWKATRIAEMDRNVVAPAGVSDGDPDDLGDWESSGVLDVTALFETAPGETLLIADVQAHSIRDGVIGGGAGLVEGGQLIFLNNWGHIDPPVDGE
jgi:secreted PhoX family phosphatase